MYRIARLTHTAKEIYRIEVLKPWLFGHWGRSVWKLHYEVEHDYDGSPYGRLVEYRTLADAQERVAELKVADTERLARSLGLWRVVWP